MPDSMINDLTRSFSHSLWSAELSDKALRLYLEIEQNFPDLYKKYIPEVLVAVAISVIFKNQYGTSKIPVADIRLHCRASQKDMDDASTELISRLRNVERGAEFRALGLTSFSEEVDEDFPYEEEKDFDEDDEVDLDDEDLDDEDLDDEDLDDEDLDDEDLDDEDLDDEDLDDLDDEDEQEEALRQLRHRVVFRFPITCKGKPGRAKKIQTLKFAEEIAQHLDDEYGFTKVVETSFVDKHNQMSITLDAPMGAILLFVIRVENQNIKIGKGQYVDESKYDDISDDNLYRPSDHYLHFIETYVSWGRDEFQNEQEHRDFMEFVKGKTPEELQALMPPSPESQAWLDALKAYDLPRKESLQELDRILKIDSECLEALICKTGWNPDPEARIDLLEEIIETGEHRIHALLAKGKIQWWGDHRTRPYLLAMEHLADELIMQGYIDEGLEVYQELLVLNPQDNQGVRYQMLAESLLHHKSASWDFVHNITKNESTPFVLYCQALHLFRATGNKSASKKAAVKAFKSLPYPLLILQADEESSDNILDDLDEQSRAQTIYTTILIERLDHKNPRLIKWLLKTIKESGWTYGDKDSDHLKLN